MKAALRKAEPLCTGKHVRIHTDNTTTLLTIQNKGSARSPPCNDLAREILVFCEKREITLTMAFCPGVDNTMADEASRQFKDSGEWAINPDVLSTLLVEEGGGQVVIDIDLFASSLNRKCVRYVAWGYDPNAFAIDAFSLDWSGLDALIFPPFSVIPRVLQKIRKERPRGLLILPHWTTQPWFNAARTLPRRAEKRIAVDRNTLCRRPDESHPCAGRMSLWILTL